MPPTIRSCPRSGEDARHMPARGHDQGIMLFAQSREAFDVHRMGDHEMHAHVFNAFEFLEQQVVVQTFARI